MESISVKCTSFILLLFICKLCLTQGQEDPRNGFCSKDGCNEVVQKSIGVVITCVGAVSNGELHRKFKQTVVSMLKHSSRSISLHIITDAQSRELLRNTLNALDSYPSKFTFSFLDVNKLAEQLEPIIQPMQEYFSYKPGSYYNHAMFFLSVAFHKVMPNDVERIIMLDADLKFNDDIDQLFELFQDFSKDNIIGIAREAQPVYRHIFWSYRSKHPGTLVGEPPPRGLTGFNSGVLLLHLDKMRNSKLYNSFLDASNLSQLASEFDFKGHLGDQDFYTLLSMKYEQLFYVLPCRWNRQLCQWWKDHGYQDIFYDYFACEGSISIYHGNCNTPIPE